MTDDTRADSSEIYAALARFYGGDMPVTPEPPKVVPKPPAPPVPRAKKTSIRESVDETEILEIEEESSQKKREPPREEREDLGRDVEVRQRDPRAAHLMREELCEILGMNEATLDEELTEAALVGPLNGKRLFECSLRDDARIEQEPSKGNRAHHPASDHRAPAADLVARTAPQRCMRASGPFGAALVRLAASQRGSGS